ncbi:MAG: NAD(P)/FAD-dependent oxidoreductase [bacterium]|nr:NAD(P)/FAD-dependent oxidoreductase [bacterium]
MDEIEAIGRYDVIVIGSGLAGLLAGNGLARKGYRVLMLEEHSIPGGCTTNFERKGYRFEASNHVMNGCERGGMTYAQLEKVGAHERAEFIKIHSFGRQIDEIKGTNYELPWATDAHVEMLIENFPDEEEGIRGYYARFGPMAEALLSTYAPQDPDDKAQQERVRDAVAEFGALAGKTGKQVLDEYVSHPELIRLMSAIPSGFLGTPCEEVAAGMLIMTEMVFRANGGSAYYPKGGSGQLSQVLADHFEDNGGELQYNRRVTEIVFEDGRAAGVIARKRKGQYISAQARAVVCAADLTALVSQMCPQGTFPAEYVKSIEESVPSMSAVMLFLGLDIDVRDYGIHECKLSRAWGAADVGTMFGEAALEADYSQLPIGSVTIYSNMDPTCCPEGKSVVAMLVLGVPEVFEPLLGRGRQRGRAYKEKKQEISAQLLATATRTLGIPDLEEHVEVLELATPLTIERFTGNRGGAYVGWKYTPAQAEGGFPQTSPVENLILAGHWVVPGGGVCNAMAGGNNAAELVDTYLQQSTG